MKPEMFAQVNVSKREGMKAILIPTSALISKNGKNFVVVYNSNKDMGIAEVSIIKTVADKTYINSGVNPGQKLIVKNQLLIFQQLLND